MDVAIVGATGLVGQVILEILDKSKIKVDNIYGTKQKKEMEKQQGGGGGGGLGALGALLGGM